uniref:Sodium/calcium exchanger membrane region domain-containing protein n=1 Tax=Glossina brevipalpis TaxID=37001 RepID=A0A1A9WX88_9MUSC
MAAIALKFDMNATNQFLNASIGNALLSQKVLNRGKRHESYVGIPSERERCYRSLNIDESAEESCKFVWNNPNCLTLDPLIEYLRILVCHLEVPNNILGICFILFFALFFIVLYSTFMFVISKYFLLPNSLVLLTRFKMKEYSFGSGVLALIFTVPEIMSNILTCFTQHRNYAVLYSARVGKTVHCLLFGVGLICVFAHGRIDGATLMRDIAFTAVGFTFTYGVMRHEMHNLRKLEHQRSYPIIHICAYMSLLIFLIYLVNVLVFSKRNLRKSTLEREMEAKSRNPNTSEQDISIPSSSESFDSNEYPHQAENPIEENVDPIAVFLKSISPFHNVDGGPLFKLTLVSALFHYYGLSCAGRAA